MPTKPHNLTDVVQLGATSAAIYTAPTRTRTRITAALISNDSATERTADFYIVPSGGSAAGTNRVVKELAVGVSQPPRRILGLEGQVLGPGDAVHASASAASALNVRLSGLEITGDGID